jgi:hypothetical protein
MLFNRTKTKTKELLTIFIEPETLHNIAVDFELKMIDVDLLPDEREALEKTIVTAANILVAALRREFN